MEAIDSLEKLPFHTELAVIINCGTKWFTTLALASAARHAAMPILLIDCESQDGSEDHFRQLSDALDFSFYWLNWPLRPHGEALDQLFADIPAERVLLVDSDLEIVNDSLVGKMKEKLLTTEGAYGAGFLHSGGWMSAPDHYFPPHTAFYAERMWIPLVLLDTQRIRRALDDGHSFLARKIYLEFPSAPRLARFLSQRYRLPWIRNVRLPRKSNLPEDWPYPERPAFIDYDTGALIHRSLTQRQQGFAPL